MLVLLALPVLCVVAATHRCLEHYAPSNLLIRGVRLSAPRGRTVAGLLTLDASLLLAMHALAAAIAAGAPGWLNLVVLLLAWDTIKIGLLAVSVGARRAKIAGRAQRTLKRSSTFGTS